MGRGRFFLCVVLTQHLCCGLVAPRPGLLGGSVHGRPGEGGIFFFIWHYQKSSNFAFLCPNRVLGAFLDSWGVLRGKNGVICDFFFEKKGPQPMVRLMCLMPFFAENHMFYPFPYFIFGNDQFWEFSKKIFFYMFLGGSKPTPPSGPQPRSWTPKVDFLLTRSTTNIRPF